MEQRLCMRTAACLSACTEPSAHVDLCRCANRTLSSPGVCKEAKLLHTTAKSPTSHHHRVVYPILKQLASDDTGRTACWAMHADSMQSKMQKCMQVSICQSVQGLLALHGHLGVAKYARKP